LKSPELFISDFAKFESTRDAACGVPIPVRNSATRITGCLAARNTEDASAVVALAKKIDAEIDDKIVTELS